MFNVSNVIRSVLTKYPAIAVLQVVIAKVVIVEVSRLVRKVGGARLRLQKEVGGGGCMNKGSVLKGSLLSKDLTVLHTKIAWLTNSMLQKVQQIKEVKKNNNLNPYSCKN